MAALSKGTLIILNKNHNVNWKQANQAGAICQALGNPHASSHSCFMIFCNVVSMGAWLPGNHVERRPHLLDEVPERGPSARVGRGPAEDDIGFVYL